MERRRLKREHNAGTGASSVMRRLALLSTIIAGLATTASGTQDATFKSANRTVAVYTTVADAAGHPVLDLDRSSFSLFDNGKRQTLTVFASDEQPITVVMMIDRSVSMRANFELVEKAAEQFVAALGPKDRARIGSFSNRIQVDPREFTSSHDELLEILRRELQEEGPTPLWNAVNVGITALLHQEGRRVILAFTDGMDDPFNQSPNNSSLKSVMKRADEEDVMVYAIGLAGHSGPGPGGGRFGGPGGGPGGGRGGGGGGFGGGRGGGRGGPPRRSGAASGKPDPGLERLAFDTGGGYFELTSTADLASTFARVAEELHHQYLLGFSPSLLDGKTHKLDVQTRNPALTVRARKSYMAAVDR